MWRSGRLAGWASGGRDARWWERPAVSGLAVALWLWLVLATGGCASLGLDGSEGGRASASSGDASGGEAGSGPMTQARMELIFAERVEAIEGPSGALRTQVQGVNVYLISDPANDRMRLLAQIARVEQAPPQLLRVLLEANFHSTLDARYAISEGVIYSAFLHPMSSLTPELIESGLDQVVSLALTFGKSFSSGKLFFGTSGAEGR